MFLLGQRFNEKPILNILLLGKITNCFLFCTPRKMNMYLFQASLLIYKKLLRQDGLFFNPKEFEDISLQLKQEHKENGTISCFSPSFTYIFQLGVCSARQTCPSKN